MGLIHPGEWPLALRLEKRLPNPTKPSAPFGLTATLFEHLLTVPFPPKFFLTGNGRNYIFIIVTPSKGMTIRQKSFGKRV